MKLQTAALLRQYAWSVRTADGDLQPHCPSLTDEDMTDYKIYLNPGNTETMEHIKLISAICHVNYLQARKLLSSQKPVLIYKAEQEAASSLKGRKGSAGSKMP